MTVESRAKMSAASKGKPKSASHCANISKGQLGRRHTLESRTKMSIAKKIWVDLPGSREKLAHNKGRIVSEDIRKRTSETLKGRIFSREHRLKLSLSATTKYKSWPRFEYGGILFRFRWEVAAAKEFDRQEIVWGYETKRFILNEVSTYCPDFYLPEFNCYWEVKGYFDPKSKAKIALFREKYPEVSLVVATEPVLKLLGAQL